MSVDTEYQAIESAKGTKFYIGAPINLLSKRQHQNITDAFILGLSSEEYVKWMTARGAKEINRNSETNFIIFAFSEKKKASKTAKELTKAYLRYRMGK